MPNDRNSKVPDAITAFLATSKKGHRIEISGAKAFGAVGHVQGIVRYGAYYFVTESAEESTFDHGWICVLDAEKNKLLSRKSTPSTPGEKMNHPGGMQVCGDYLCVGVQEYEPGHKGANSTVLIYDLTAMTNGELPDPVVHKVDGVAAGAAAVTDIPPIVRVQIKPGSPVSERYHLLVCHDDGALTFILSDGQPLGTAAFDFRLDARAVVPANLGAEQIGLFCDYNDQIYLVQLISQPEKGSLRDMVRLFRVQITTLGVVTMTEQRFPPDAATETSQPSSDANHFVTHHGIVPGVTGVHFRYGGGVRVTPDGGLEYLASEMSMWKGSANFIPSPLGFPISDLEPVKFAVNVFAATASK